MLSPVAELVSSSPRVGRLGMDSITLWKEWLGELGEESALRHEGSLLVAHHRDAGELGRVRASIAAKSQGDKERVIALDKEGMADMEPALGHVHHGYFLPDEGCLDTDKVMDTLRKACEDSGVVWNDKARVDSVGNKTISQDGQERTFDWACDCRGLGAAGDLPLRAVRGEIIHLHSKDVSISRPVRVAHPRHPVYIVPRMGDRLLVGATEIESSDNTPLSVRSALELLGTAYGLIPALAEARIVDTRVGLRPALPDNEPVCSVDDGKIAVNGLYRHGFLAAPALVREAVGAMGLA